MTEHRIIAPHEKRKMYENQNGMCAYCRRERKLKHMTVDHIVPLSRGGLDDASNLQLTCKMCNRLKDNMLPSEFVKYTWKLFANSAKAYLITALQKGGAV